MGVVNDGGRIKATQPLSPLEIPSSILFIAVRWVLKRTIVGEKVDDVISFCLSQPQSSLSDHYI